MRRFPLSQVLKASLMYSAGKITEETKNPFRKIKFRSANIATLETLNIRNFRGNAANGESILKGHFIHANQLLDVGRQGDPWPVVSPSEKFAFWHHGFDWLWDLSMLGSKEAAEKARTLVDQWITHYGDWNSFAWQPDILSVRLYAWLGNWNSLLSTDRLDESGQVRRNNLFRQIRHLKACYSKCSPGVDKLRAAIVITLAGLVRPDKSYDLVNRGLDWVDEQLHLQILPDGGHISRRPADCVSALELLTALDQALEKHGVDGSNSINRALERLRHIIPFFQMPDGGLASFNGSGKGDPVQINNLLKFSKTTASPFVYCPHTGYQRVHQNDTVIIIDTGETTSFPFDKDAHLAPLAFEMSTKGGRLIVNCGWNENQPSSWRESMRLTAAHSTLTITELSAGELVGNGIRGRLFENHVGADIDNVEATRREQSEGVWLEMAHNGYKDRTGLSHRRKLYIHESGNDIRGEDALLVPIGQTPISHNALPFEIRFHLHPSVKATLAQDLHSALLIQSGQIGWRFRTDGGPLRIEESVYLAEGDKPVKTEQIVISGSAFADGDGESKSNRVRWSIRKLEPGS